MLFAPSDGGDPPFPGADKVVHLALFAALATSTRWRFGARRPALGLVAAYAVASELVQAHLLASRNGDVLDVFADLLGVAAGWLAVGWLLRRG